MKISLKEKIGYGLGDTASNFVWGTISAFLMFYYTDIFGITAAAVGVLFLFARVFDGFSDFVMGAIADRTKTRWGKFRPYILWMCIPLAITFVLTFTTPNFGNTGKIVYAWITYNLLMLLYTAVNIPYSALSGVMTDDPEDRTSLNSFRMALAQIGGLVVNATTLILIGQLGGGDQARGYQLTVIIFSVIMVALFLLTFATTRERIQPPPAQKTRLKDDLRTLFQNRHWLVLFATGLTNLTFIIGRCGAMMYYFKYYLRMDEFQQSLYMVFGSIAFIIGAVSTGTVVRAVGRKLAFILSMAATGLTAIPLLWLDPTQRVPLFELQLFGGIAAGINATLYWSMIADAADYSEWKFNVRTTGIVFSATTCSQKVGMGIGGAFAGLWLTQVGYVPGAQQTPEAIHGILLLMSVIPGIGFLLLAGFFHFYGLTEDVCETMRAELAQRRLEQAPAREESAPVPVPAEAVASAV